jgi:hypothetical protein
VNNDRLFNNPDHTRLLSVTRTWAQLDFANKTLVNALRKFMGNNQGQFPTDVSQLATYFSPPVDNRALQDWTILPARDFRGAQMAGLGHWVITQKRAVDATNDQRLAFGIDGAVRAGMSPAKDWLIQ